jgi:hypothetical protein
MSTEYAVWIYSPDNTRLGVIPMDRVYSLSYSLVTNAVGALVIEMADDAIDPTWAQADARLEVRRKPDGGTWALEGQTVWFVQKMTRGVTQAGRYRRLTADSANTLLERRYTLFWSGTSPVVASSNYAENVIKDTVLQNLGSSANTASTYSAGVTPTRIMADFTVEGNGSKGAVISKEFAWRSVLSVIQDIANDSATAGSPIYFGVIWTGSGFLFRTWLGQPGINRTTAPNLLIVSAERGSLGGTIEVTEDWNDTATWVTTGGEGQGTARQTGSQWDVARIGRSTYGLREVFVNTTALKTGAALNAEASAELYRRRPKQTLSGQIISVPGATYGIDWGHGDRLMAQFEHAAFSALVETVTVKLDNGTESIDAKIVGEPTAQ